MDGVTRGIDTRRIKGRTQAEGSRADINNTILATVDESPDCGASLAQVGHGVARQQSMVAAESDRVGRGVHRGAARCVKGAVGECRHRLAVGRVNGNVPSRIQFRSRSDSGRNSRLEGDRGVQDPDLDCPAGGTVILGVGVRLRDGVDPDVVADLNRSPDLRIHGGTGLRGGVGNSHLNQSATTGVGPRIGDVVPVRLDREIDCAGTDSIQPG